MANHFVIYHFWERDAAFSNRLFTSVEEAENFLKEQLGSSYGPNRGLYTIKAKRRKD